MPRARQLSRRARKRVEVRYGPDEPRFIGYSGNVSKSGIMVRAVRVFAPGTILTLELKLPGGTVRVRGLVIWAREGSVQWMATGRVGMGITFIDPPEDIVSLAQPPADPGALPGRS